jgi:hypothetical protein
VDGSNDEDDANFEDEEEGKNENNSDNEGDADEFYKSSLFNDGDDDSIDDAAYHVPSAKGAGPGHVQRNPTLMVYPKRNQRNLEGRVPMVQQQMKQSLTLGLCRIYCDP